MATQNLNPLSVLARPSRSQSITFGDYTDRKEDMGDTVATVVSSLANRPVDWQYMAAVEEYAGVQGRLYNLSWRNALLVALQYPQATHIKHEDTWKRAGVATKDGTDKIWIWEPIYAPACPKCGNTEAYHSKPHVSCTYHRTGTPEHWPTDVVGTTPEPYYDVSQVTGSALGSHTNQSPLQNIGGRALESISEQVLSEDGYNLNIVSGKTLDVPRGRLRRSAMTLRPIIEVVSAAQPYEALSAVKYHLLADFTTDGENYGYTDRDETLASWILYCIGSHIGYHESHYTPDSSEAASIGNTPEEVKAAFQMISTTTESHLNRLEQHVRRRQREHFSR